MFFYMGLKLDYLTLILYILYYWVF